MRKVSEYQKHAEECQKMAARMKDSTHKSQLEDMANAWAMLARERTKQIEKQANGAILSRLLADPGRR